MILSPEQVKNVTFPLTGQLFLEGPVGSGKTTTAVHRILHLINRGVPADKILVLLPQRTLVEPYVRMEQSSEFPDGGKLEILTLGGLAQRSITLFWPMVAAEAGFRFPHRPPVYLTLETAQYFLSTIVTPLLSEGYFSSLTIDRNRLLSQILDNLNKAAVAGFPVEDIAGRLKASWVGDPSQFHLYDEAQECALRFRNFCFQNNLLDYSLQLKTFIENIWSSHLCQNYLAAKYRHLVYDNIEEDVPVAHDVVEQWLPTFESVLLVRDHGGGYRTFLGADPESANRFTHLIPLNHSLEGSWITHNHLQDLGTSLVKEIAHNPSNPGPDTRLAFEVIHSRFIPQMLEWVAQRISRYIQDEKVNPGEIVILSPYLSDSLRFSLAAYLEAFSVPSRSYRPSRSLKEEPIVKCLLTFARLAHPEWNLPVSIADVRDALYLSLEGIDMVRADLLSRIVFRTSQQTALGKFDQLLPTIQERVGYALGEQYESIRNWLVSYCQNEPAALDVFLARLFGEVLSQPGFGFHVDFEAASIAARLIDSIRKFRSATRSMFSDKEILFGREYQLMLSSGVIAAQYWMGPIEETNTVYLLPAHTFLMSNHPATIQFWLNIGSPGWWERLYQPLTHPHVLSRRWQKSSPWTDRDEVAYNQTSLARLVAGLIERCRQKIYFCTSEINESGDETRGPLLLAIQTLLKRMIEIPDVHRV